MSRATAIIIVNYRTPELTIQCLRSLQSEIPWEPDLKVFVVDNASGDHSNTLIPQAISSEDWPWVEYIPHPINAGFSAGNNVGIRKALAQVPAFDYVLLLNPDTYIRPRAISILIDYMAAHPCVGLVGSRLEDPDGTPQISSFHYPSWLGEVEDGLRLGIATKLLARYRVPRPVTDLRHQTDWLAGASLIIHRAVFDDIGLMDENYFLYFEETDFCAQASAAGWPIIYLPQSRVVHLVGQSTGVSETRVARKRRPGYWFESRHRFFHRQYGYTYTLLADAAYILSRGLWELRAKIQRKPNLDPPHLLSDFIRHAIRFALTGRTK